MHTPGNLDTVKEAAKTAVDAALAEKAKAIEANDKLSDAEKAAAKEEAKKAADEAKKAIEAATDQTGVDAKAAEGKAAVEAVNPVGKEKAKAVVEGSTTSGITKLSSEVVKTGETEQSSNKVSNKQLPNTGTTETNTGLAGLGLGILGGLLAAARRRKNDKN